jgi:hypothetical protein
MESPQQTFVWYLDLHCSCLHINGFSWIVNKKKRFLAFFCGLTQICCQEAYKWLWQKILGFGKELNPCGKRKE